MRIIAGAARGKTLLAPEGLDTRPTSDRTRESLFNILAPRIMGARVLDLFSGSGAICAEALSRGAAYCVAVDADPAACRVIRRNLELKNIEGRSEVLQCDFRKALGAVRGPFDIVYADPPYKELGFYTEAAKLLAERKLLANDGILILECESTVEPVLPEGFCITDVRRYGRAKLCFVRQEVSQ